MPTNENLLKGMFFGLLLALPFWVAIYCVFK